MNTNNKGGILFVAEYPNESTIKEGMSQRMIAIDGQFLNDQRAYLFVSHRFFLKKEITQIANGVKQYKCNLFLHFFFILKLLVNSKFIYFHSIQNALPILPCLLFLKSDKRMILDIHGVVPEEHILAGQSFKSKLYSITEKYLFSRLYLAISVTDAMTRHFKTKYPDNQVKMMTYPILPSNIRNDTYDLKENDDRNFVNVIYSGNLQAWQNIDLMINVISNNLSPHVKYTILTGNPTAMTRVLTENGLKEENNVFVFSVLPEFLGEYYSKADYGFILRDDITVNNVACPTKVVEYMHYGLIPIVKSKNIGDFYNLGYEYLDVKDFNVETIRVGKSKKNKSIIAELKDKCDKINIRSFLMENVES
ncbi:hypothetical protein TH53_02435 [Pedobacter lusitanus]|uniref:Glycosyl transferase family 1 n=1 Tax=Pedobacter lusitanus TaxID=1503925 RepID=A0A0D0GQZ2_9SPHI|nr:hypothetical protein [Pedobacter lusitanus]KIO78625.1 hypothetical protein TH53_02435 [Pedobacter lusitanus]